MFGRYARRVGPDRARERPVGRLTRHWAVRAGLAAALLGPLSLVPRTSAMFTAVTGSGGSSLDSASVAPVLFADAVQVCSGGVPSASVTWMPSPGSIADGYHVTRSGGPTIDATPGTATSAVDGPLANGTTYTYTITAFTGQWQSAPVTVGLTTGCSPDPANGAYLLARTGGSGGAGLVTRASLTDTNPATNETSLGTGTGAKNMNALEIDPASGRLVASAGKQLGWVDATTGAFTAVTTLPTVRTSSGTQAVDRTPGLAFDSRTGRLWATVNNGGSDSMLVEIDPATLQVRTDTFGAGLDARWIAPQGGSDTALDLAVNPITGVMYVLMGKADGKNTVLCTLDPTSGATTVVGTANPTQLEGLDFDASGRLWAVGKGATDALVRLDPATGATLYTEPLDNGGSYEGVAIRVPPSEVASVAPVGPSGGVVTLTAPGSVQPGDLLLTWVGSSQSTITAPPGWTLGASASSGPIDSGDIATNGALFWKLAGPSDPGASFGFGGVGTSAIGTMVVYRGVRQVSPLNAASAVAYGFTTTPTAPSITTTVSDTELVAIFHHEEPTTGTAPSGMTQRVQGALGNYVDLVADQMRVATGATGGRTASFGAIDDGIAVLVALAPG